MSREYEKPTEIFRDDNHPIYDREYAHPAFGKVTLTKSSWGGGDGVNLFGSDLKHSQTVSITVELAREYRDLHNSRQHGRGIVCELMMSEAQWAHFISSQGDGSGTPVTFRARPADGYELIQPPMIEREETPQETFAREVREKCERYAEDALGVLAQVQELAAAGKATKTQLQALARTLDLMAHNVPSNLAFAQEQFAETMAKTVHAGKIELEAYVQNMALRTGLDVLRLQAPRFPDEPSTALPTATEGE
jgi:hypothetical protein